MFACHQQGEEGVALIDFLAKDIVALQNFLDFLQAKFNQHRCNLRSLVTLKLLYEVVNCGSDLLFVHWVIFGYALDDLFSLLEVSLSNTVIHLLGGFHLLHGLFHVLTHRHVLLRG